MTSFLATTVTQSVEVLTNAVANVADVMEGSYEGAEILGIHFEGPYPCAYSLTSSWSTLRPKPCLLQTRNST